MRRVITCFLVEYQGTDSEWTKHPRELLPPLFPSNFGGKAVERSLSQRREQGAGSLAPGVISGARQTLPAANSSSGKRGSFLSVWPEGETAAPRKHSHVPKTRRAVLEVGHGAILKSSWGSSCHQSGLSGWAGHMISRRLASC